MSSLTRSTSTRWHVARSAEDWLANARALVGAAERAALAAHGRFDIVLAGGGTPRRLYAALAEEARDWTRWHVWFGDERCLPADHRERNSRMAAEALLERVPICAAHIHAMPAELGAEVAALAYGKQLARLGAFDLVLLGLGEDGHTASLFPGRDWGEADDAPDALAVHAAPKPPPERISLSARRLSDARAVLFLVAGVDKREAVARWRRGERLPAGAIRAPAGVDVLLHTDACPTGETT